MGELSPVRTLVTERVPSACTWVKGLTALSVTALAGDAPCQLPQRGAKRERIKYYMFSTAHCKTSFVMRPARVRPKPPCSMRVTKA